MIIISAYLMRYKGKYRLKVPYDKCTNQFSRKLNGTLEDCDMYIDCAKGCKIFQYNRDILQAYIPSIGQGHNIIKEIYAKHINPSNAEIKETTIDTKEKTATRISYFIIDNHLFESDLKNPQSMIFDIVESDFEVMFKFNSKHIDIIAQLLKAKTSGANISPFSSKNLPKNKEFRIPVEELSIYKSIVAQIPPEKILILTHMTNKFIKKLSNRKNPIQNVKADMALKGLSGKNYIYSIGKWDEYIKFLQKNLKL